MPFIHRQAVPIAAGQARPRAPRPGTGQDPVDRPPVIRLPPVPAGITGQQWPQPPPFFIRKVVPGNHSTVIYTFQGSDPGNTPWVGKIVPLAGLRADPHTVVTACSCCGSTCTSIRLGRHISTPCSTVSEAGLDTAACRVR